MIIYVLYVSVCTGCLSTRQFQRAKGPNPANQPCTAMPCPSHLDGVKSTRLDQGEGRPCDTETRQTIIRVSSEGRRRLRKIRKRQKKTTDRKGTNQNGENNALLKHVTKSHLQVIDHRPAVRSFSNYETYCCYFLQFYDVSCSSASSKSSS